MSAFRYLGRVMTAGDDNSLAVVSNLGKALRSWGRLSRFMVQEVADPKLSRTFYTAVVQAVLLFGEGTWVPHSEDGEGPGQFSVQGRKKDHWEATAAKE